MTTMQKAAAVAGLTVGISALVYRAVHHAPVPPTIVTAAVSRGPIVATVETSGTLEAVDTVEVGTQISGTIRTLAADFDSIVRKGDIIATLDPTLLDAQVRQDRATLAERQANLDSVQVTEEQDRHALGRARDLTGKRLMTTADLETAEVTEKTALTQIAAARAELAQARATLQEDLVNRTYTIIRAPTDGIVVARDVDVGQTVAARMEAPTLFVIARDLRRMRVNASVDESDVGRVRVGQPVTFSVDAYPGDVFGGMVSEVREQPLVLENTVTYDAIVDVANPQLKLRPGMTALVNIETGRRDDVPRVPNAALRFTPSPEVFAALGQPAPIVPDVREAATSQPAVERAAARTSASRLDEVSVDSQPSPRSVGRVWVYRDGRLTPLTVTLGLGDAMATEVLGQAPEPGTLLAVNAVSHGSLFSAAVPSPARR